MQNPSSPISDNAGAPEKKRFRLFSWRTLGRCLIALAIFVTLIAIFYAEEDWRGKHAWEKYRREAQARGEELDWSKFIPAAVPDDQNFAMTPFFKPLFDFVRENGQTAWRDTNARNRIQNFGETLRKAIPSPQNQTPAASQSIDLPGLAGALQKNDPQSISKTEAAQFILDYMRQYQPVLDELRAASKRPYSRFDVQYNTEDPFSILLPHLMAIKSIAATVRIKAEAELALGKTNAAFDDVRFILYLTDSVQTEPFLISHLVRFATSALAQRVILEGLAEHSWSDRQLKTFQSDLAKVSFLKDTRYGMESERAGVGRFFENLHRKKGPNLADVGLDSVTRGMNLLPDGWLYFEQVNYLRYSGEKMIPGANADGTQVFPRFLEDSAAELQKNGNHFFRRVMEHEVFIQILSPSAIQIYQKAAVAQTGAQQALIACALERYRLANGKYPQILDALVPKFLESVPLDVCDGKPMKYHLKGDGQFVLYSVGWNQTDEDGKTVMEKGKPGSVDRSKGDWVWLE